MESTALRLNSPPIQVIEHNCLCEKALKGIVQSTLKSNSLASVTLINRARSMEKEGKVILQARLMANSDKLKKCCYGKILIFANIVFLHRRMVIQRERCF